MAEYLSKFTGARVDSAVEKIPATLPTEDSSIIVISKDGTTGYTTLSSLGAGDVVAAGNNAFTGNNTFAGSSTFDNSKGIDIGTKAAAAPWMGIKFVKGDFRNNVRFYHHVGGVPGGENYAYFPAQNGVIALTPETDPTEDSLLVYNTSRASSWKKLSELGVGDVTAAGNNVFAGTNTFGLNTYFPNGISLCSSDSAPQVNELYEISKSGLRVMGGDTSGILVKFSDLTNVTSTDTTRTIPFLEQANEFTAANSFIYKNTTAALQTTIKLDAEDGGITVGSGGIGAIAQYVKISSTGISRKSSGASAATYNYSLPDASGTLAVTDDIPDIQPLKDRLDKIETLLAPGLAETKPRALYWLLTE